MLIWAVAVHLDWLPVSGMLTPQSVILPAFALSLGYMALIYVCYGRNVNQWHQPYVFYARTRGLPDKLILRRHILRNSLRFCADGARNEYSETYRGHGRDREYFAWPGWGLCISAIFGRDYPMIQAYILMMSLLFFFNFLIDIIQMKSRSSSKAVTMWRLFWQRLAQDKSAQLCLLVIVMITIAGIGAPWFCTS